MILAQLRSAMADVGPSLQAAKAALESKDYKSALSHVQAALKADPKSYDALVCVLSGLRVPT